MCNVNNEFELESQLHEQYAINNNANVGSFVSFIVALLALFGFFGYVFIYSTIQFSINGRLITNGIMTLDVFLSFSIIVVGMLFFLSLISLQLGYSSRMNQIIIDRIRDKSFGSKNKTLIFGKSYSPKGKTWCSFIQDYFNLFYWLFLGGQILVVFFTVFKILQNISMSNSEWNWCWGFFVIFIFLIQLATIFFSFCLRSRYFIKYCYAFEDAIARKMIKESCFLTKIKFCNKH